jgi:nucleoside-diphosphate-sugar epimerase
MILITGASGFLGRSLVRLALRQGRPVRAFVRKSSAELEALVAEQAQAGGPRGEIYQRDLTIPESLEGAMPGVTAVVHAAATTSETAPDEDLSRRTNVEGTRRLLEAAARAGVARWVQISSLSANPANTSVYGRTKYAADEEVRRSSLRWTILQPGTIFGPGGRGLFAKIVRLTSSLPIVPVLGPGTQPMRPIFVDDCAAAALAVIDRDETAGKTYALGCRDVITFNDFLRGVLEMRGSRKPLVHVPFWVCFPAARVLGLFLKNPPVTVDNLVGLKQMTAPDISAAERDFGFAPLTFREGLGRTFAATEGAATEAVDPLKTTSVAS